RLPGPADARLVDQGLQRQDLLPRSRAELDGALQVLLCQIQVRGAEVEPRITVCQKLLSFGVGAVDDLLDVLVGLQGGIKVVRFDEPVGPDGELADEQVQDQAAILRSPGGRQALIEVHELPVGDVLEQNGYFRDLVFAFGKGIYELRHPDVDVRV